ncbi:hypothetical protein PG993_014079 [Apiospora rasikravindrae]|uniref:Uncharacterized protein n=1 Tax=Apiospora rasikravindrae TaxID=990691 RepID=A0ABR1RS58_9PEZI
MQHGLIGDRNGESKGQHMDEAAALGVVWHSTGPVETPDFTSLEYWVGPIDRILEGKPTTHQNYSTA